MEQWTSFMTFQKCFLASTIGILFKSSTKTKDFQIYRAFFIDVHTYAYVHICSSSGGIISEVPTIRLYYLHFDI